MDHVAIWWMLSKHVSTYTCSWAHHLQIAVIKTEEEIQLNSETNFTVVLKIKILRTANVQSLVPGGVVCVLHTWTWSVFRTALGVRCCYCHHFTDEETEAKQSPRSLSWWVAELGLEPQAVGPGVPALRLPASSQLSWAEVAGGVGADRCPSLCSWPFQRGRRWLWFERRHWLRTDVMSRPYLGTHGGNSNVFFHNSNFCGVILLFILAVDCQKKKLKRENMLS